ncbi:MAG TPA: prenyltransferase/squalene oxidase repeat-containing protein [Candidatus Saccharimonadales bacterium]|nr:prenyltransferase/squalene oxidase repeat-containing protein [Candidatus Saccharimonadales bacterium]
MDVSLQKALHFLQTAQQSDGSFLSNSSSQQTPFVAQHTYHTIFAPALILSALATVPRTAAIRQKLADFLLAQKNPHWSFNYWTRTSLQNKTMPYPDDLDDTFCALTSLWLHDSSLITEEALAHMAKLLIATEVAVGGPYRTWLVAANSPKIWLDTDIAVNANVAYFLQLAVQPLPNLTAYLETAIVQQAFRSPYYPDMYPIIYYIARTYRGPQQAALARVLCDNMQSDGHWGTPLRTALAVSALYNLQQPVAKTAPQYLLATQQSDGSWPAEAFCIDPTRDGMVHYGGSAALTTAFVLEALQTKKPRVAKPAAQPKRPSTYTAAIAKQAIADCQNLSVSVRQPLLATLKHAVHGKNGEEIIALAHHFYKDLRQPLLLKPEVINHLATANLYGWTAYTLYDDVLDGDAPPAVLPAANVAMRRSVHHFEQAAPDNAAWLAHLDQVFTTMDSANAWETAHCRFAIHDQQIAIGALPKFGKRQQLANRSLGHTLVPAGVLAAAGILPQDSRAQKLQEALCHYLIAKQLNDDAHDWEDDLRAGQNTYVVTHILRSLRIPPGTYDLEDLMAKSAHQFWHRSLPQICKTISLHIASSRQALTSSGLLKPDNVVSRLLDSLDQVMANTRSTITQTEAFLKAYRS